jgi:hypothetical protein
LNVAGKEDTIKREATDTELELESYLKRSDGGKCPLYDNCYSRLSGKLCPCEVMWHIIGFMDSGQFHIQYCDFLKLVAYDKPFQLVEKLAYHWLNKAGARDPPTPSEIISVFDAQHPVEVRLVDMKCHHGAIWYIDNEWVVQLNLNDDPLVRRLTLFHEAFHIISRIKFNIFESAPNNNGQFYECLAEYFALCLLMPAVWIDDLWHQTCDLDKISRILQAPLSAVYIRLKYLQLL